MGPSITNDATIPLAVRPATMVVIFQCPCGTASTRGSPFGAQPWRRVMLVDTPLSSRNTRLVDSMKRCHTCQRRRCRATSGRSCSAALKAFFIRQLEPMKHVGDGRERLHHDAARMEGIAHLL